MIITIASSDKLTLAMFADFYKSIYSADIKIVDLNCLYSEDILSARIEEIVGMGNSGRDILIKFKMKTQTKEISSILIDKSDLLVKFDIYSTEPEVIKDCGSNTALIIDRWKKNIDKFNQQKI
jgi:hypothetical protein